MSATNDEILAALKEISIRMGHLEDRMGSLETSVDGVYEYVRKAVEGDHNDVAQAERERDEAREQAAAAELERIAALENHERSTRGGE